MLKIMLAYCINAYQVHNRPIIIFTEWICLESLDVSEEGPSFRVETSCSIKRLLEDEELCCWPISINGSV